MTLAIEFNDQLRAVAGEVGYVRSEWNLPPETELRQPLAKYVPQSAFEYCRFTPQSAGANDRADLWNSFHDHFLKGKAANAKRAEMPPDLSAL